MKVFLSKYNNIKFICFDEYFDVNDKFKANTIYVKDDVIYYLDRKQVKLEDIK